MLPLILQELGATDPGVSVKKTGSKKCTEEYYQPRIVEHITAPHLSGCIG
jgi:hypothetical protein